MSGDDVRIRTLLRAFADDEFARWLAPDQQHRHRVYREWFGMVVPRAERIGEVVVGADGLAVQVWLPGRDGPPSLLDEDGNRRLAELAGPRAERFREFGALAEAQHPAQPHQYLAMIAVDPSAQSTGVGGAELRRALQRWDAQGLPSYLEASSARSRNLYLRLGFRDTGAPMVLPHDGPTMYPMWRDAGG
ncbi:GNAT family N-acetyltransferase [Saccharopolyspora sp. NPDC000359]|uniref:GNAT family N-acetyltransferase n=1 Tax=Saccharopolyspora sp. NPDC000359 TaxID=3154251 RepID=UPI00332E5799